MMSLREKGRFRAAGGVLLFIFICEILLFAFSGIVLWQKILLFIGGILLLLTIFIDKKVDKAILINVLLWALVGGSITMTSLWKFGSQNNLATAQTVYYLVDYHDPVLPLLLRNKTVFIEKENFFYNYVELFAQEVDSSFEFSEVILDENDLAQFTYMGQLSSLYYSFSTSPDFFNQRLVDRFNENGVYPGLYICVENIEDDTLYWLSDKDYNVYVISEEQYQVIQGEEDAQGL